MFILHSACASTSARCLSDTFTLYGFLCLGSFIKGLLDVKPEYVKTWIEL